MVMGSRPTPRCQIGQAANSPHGLDVALMFGQYLGSGRTLALPRYTTADRGPPIHCIPASMTKRNRPEPPRSYRWEQGWSQRS
jgi:hypothetical protein